jgi:hypothetical protein
MGHGLEKPASGSDASRKTRDSRQQATDLRNQSTDKLYANLGYGVLSNCEAFLRLGGADTGVVNDTWLGVGGGTKVTFYETGKWTFGGILQASWAGSDAEDTVQHEGYSSFSRYHYSVTEVQGALGACYQLNSTISLYGGPVAHFVRGTMEYKRAGWKTTDDIREASWFGGYLGAQAQIQTNTLANLEYQHVGHSDAFAIGVAYRFGKP